MDYRKYTLYNLIGALIWGAGLTYFGYLLGYIPPVAFFVEEYIDVILLAAVVLTLIPTVYHYLQSSRRAKRLAAAAGSAEPIEVPPTAEELALARENFDQDPSNDPPHRFS